MTKYQKQLRALLSPTEHRVFKKLSTPQRVQDLLDHFPENFCPEGDPIQNPHQVLVSKKAHCIEGAVLAAAAFAYHGRPALLLDLQSHSADLDHVVALFKQNGHWGAVSKTNHAVLRWRDPVYKTVRELAMSYFNEYFLPDKNKHFRTKTMLAYSKSFNLTKYPPERWWAAGDLDWLAELLDASPHYPVVPKGSKKFLRKASAVELAAMAVTQWPEPKAKRG